MGLAGWLKGFFVAQADDQRQPAGPAARPAAEAARKAFEAAAAPMLDAALSRRPVARDQVVSLGAPFARYFEALGRVHGTQKNTDFAADRFPFYCNACKLALLEHPEHWAWPFVSSIRAKLGADIEASWAGVDDWSAFCAIMPAVSEGNDALALRAWKRIERDPRLTELAAHWLHRGLEEFPDHNNRLGIKRLLSHFEHYQKSL